MHSENRQPLRINTAFNNVERVTVSENHSLNEAHGTVMLMALRQQGAAYFHMCHHMHHGAL